MNHRLVAKLLGIICMLIAFSMVLSLPWAFPLLGVAREFEWRGFLGLAGAVVMALTLGLVLYVPFRREPIRIYRKEAMAIVGLSWVLASILGALPFLLAETRRDAETPMNAADAFFEAASGMTGAGASVLTNVEDPALVPRCILFWRSAMHFLGGLGIMVLFVAILGQGSAGKALMRAEITGPSRHSVTSRMQHAAWVFASIFVGLNAILAILLMLEGMSLFDALCHAFGTVATGGFSTYNRSVGHFQASGDYPYALAIEATISVFMFLGAANFTLLYFVLLRQPDKLLADVEFRAYMLCIASVTAAVAVFGHASGDFSDPGTAVRQSLFQVMSIQTTTGFATADFDGWCQFGRGALLGLMFVGGCAGSTSCGVKVIRFVLLFKVLWLEVEQVFRPNVVRPLRLGGATIEDQDARKNLLLYFATVLVIVLIAWLAVVTVEPDATWVAAGRSPDDKLLDCASAVAASLNCTGPGLGLVGPTGNYASLGIASKLILSGLMLLGRLEIFAVLVLLMPGFWRDR
jgi:trk system potassium uptake protein TrkH